MNHKSICAVLVTYNRKELLLDCLCKLSSQFALLTHIIVINNASQDGTVDFLSEHGWVDSDTFTLISLADNQGGAGGFYTGINYAYNKGFDYIWLMDDDGFPSQDCLSILFEFASEGNYIGPLVIDSNDSSTLTFPLRLEKRKTVLSSLVDIETMGFEKIIPNIVMPFNGILFSRKLIETIGLPKKEYFIWGDDIEYTLRAKRFGFNVFTVIGAKFYHPREYSFGTPMLFNLLKFNDTNSKLKLYCMCRNNIRNLLDYKNVLIAVLFCIKILWFYLFTKPDFLKLRLAFKAIYHGLKKDFSHHKEYL